MLDINHPQPALPVSSFGDAPLQSLDPRYIRVHRISTLIGAGIVGLTCLTALAVSWLTGDLPPWVVALTAAMSLAGTALLAMLGLHFVELAYARTAYAVSREGLEIRRGVLWRTIVDVPRSRIQHTDVTQGPLDRAFGLATLVLYTAGVEHARITLDGLAFETANALRLELLRADPAAEPTTGPVPQPALDPTTETRLDPAPDGR